MGAMGPASDENESREALPTAFRFPMRMMVSPSSAVEGLICPQQVLGGLRGCQA